MVPAAAQEAPEKGTRERGAEEGRNKLHKTQLGLKLEEEEEQSANIQITGSLSQFLSLLDIGKLNVETRLTRRCPRFPCLQISFMQKNN